MNRTTPNRRSPRAKKLLSLSRDRRNGYGENAKSSRKNIPRNKAIERRKTRRALLRVLAAVEGDGIALEARKAAVRRNGWRKSPDIPLQEHIKRKLARRMRTGQS